MEKQTNIKRCTCDHTYQDKRYGKRMRVHNWSITANNKFGGWRCTVCKREK